MNEIKINQAELVDILASHDEFSGKNAEKFLVELKNIAQEALLRDQVLKVPNIGTFKLLWTEGRKSIDVRTGQEINIAGHYKLTFAPDAALKERTNATIEQNEQPKEAPLQKLSQQADEIKSMLDGLNGENEVEVAIETPESEPKEEEKVETIEIVEVPTSEPEQVEVPTSENKEEHKVEESNQGNCTSFGNTPSTVEEKTEETKEEPTPRKRHGWIWILIILLLFAIGAIIYFFYFDLAKCYYDDICNWYKSKFKTEQVEEVEDANAYEVDEMFDNSDDAVEQNVPEIFSKPRDYSKTITRVTVKKGIYLAILAEKYYGHKDFWVYIYEANKNVLTHPNVVEVATIIRIPKMDSQLVNANDAYAVEFAQKLGETYLK